MKPNNPNRRKTVEIYFILYLAALVLLIPDVRDGEFIFPEEDIERSHIPFELKPEKASLNLILMMDSSGIRQITFDSTNRIFYTGKPNNVDFEFIVEDATYFRQININPDKHNSEYFQVSHNRAEQYAEFFWMPPKDDKVNQSFNVIVKAEFEYEGNTVSKRVEFALNKNYINTQQYDYISSREDTSVILEQMRQSFITNNIVTANIGEINLIPNEYNIKTIAYSNWQNTINVTGIDLQRNLLRNPEIIVERNPEGNSGTASIQDIKDNKIVIGGKAPDYGSMNVRIKIIRDIDSREATIEFGVLPQPIGTPEIPNYMNPEKTYSFNPNLPVLSNQNTESALVDEDDRVLVKNTSGGTFRFKPDDKLAGNIVYFERYIDDKVFGQRYPIEIRKYPKPAFSRVQKIDSEKIRVFTVSYGLFNGEENFISSIDIDGNADYTEIIGQARFDEKEMVYTQVFEFTRKNKSTPFRFTATGTNRKGEKTDNLEYP